MSVPSSQIVSVWVKDELESTSWTSLKHVVFKAVRPKWGSSDENVWEFVETNVPYVAEHLRNILAECVLDGTIPAFEIDNEPTPYIRLTTTLPSDVMAKLRRIDPFQLEAICAQLLDKLGAASHTTRRTNDGGIDFVAVNLKIVPMALRVPAACKAAVIGQAKRYRDGNAINETRLREFVGAGTLKRHQMGVEGKIGPLAPVLFAFWTTSDFDPNAKRYAREMGLWYMDGQTLAAYVTDLGLRDFVMSLPETPTQPTKAAAAGDNVGAQTVSNDPVG